MEVFPFFRFFFIVSELKTLDISLLMSGEYALEDGCLGIGLSPSNVCGRFHVYDEGGFDQDNIFYETGFTKVSKFLAFDQMPNLKIRIHKALND